MGTRFDAELLEERLELPMLGLAVLWLVVFILETTGPVHPVLESLGLAIWAVFLVEFGVRLWVAPARKRFLRRNWVTAIALLLPALRLARLARLARLLRGARGLRLVRLLTSLNRGMRALGATMSRRGVGYVALLTVGVVFGAAAAMQSFEPRLERYGDALWWTAMMMTAIGSEFWPETPEGRVLCVLIALYATAVFGYVTAALASFFVGREAEDRRSPLPGPAEIEELRSEMQALRHQLRELPRPPA